MRIYYLLLSGTIAMGFCIPLKKSVHPFAHSQNDTAIIQVVPIGGNTWVKTNATEGEKITENGINDWKDKNAVFTTYVSFAHAGKLHLSVKAGVHSGKSRIRISISNKKKDLDIDGSALRVYPAGTWTINKQGYVSIQLQGISNTGGSFGNVASYSISGTAVDDQTVYVKNNADNYFYWGRRGPSTHVNYMPPATDSIEWFYNEVTVPAGFDPVGSYYMANGFNNGYFGMQVNSPTERRILFSVWSPYHTDSPESIPDSMKITLLIKGEDVKTGEFGNEGSGGQSYFLYNWITGNTYKFLLHAQPDGLDNTTYTAYFFVPEKREWKLIASFKRPKTNTYLTKLYSFLESFDPETGNIERKVYFNNQWVGYADGNWRELTHMQFTADATAQKSYRIDFAGGVENGKGFVLRSCGFFNDSSKIGTAFSRPALGKTPGIHVETLP
ncbi:MAG TPA: DUF3472 domain-containing protein [Agriterribacter sp.]|nr:DUF3472 domain-containing protein [Agriterribacter sp.]